MATLNLRAARAALDLSPDEVAGRAGLDLDAYLQLEEEGDAALGRLHLEEVRQLARVLGASVRQLLALPCSYCMEPGVDAEWFETFRWELTKEARKRLGLSLEEVAERAGLTDVEPVMMLEDLFSRDDCRVDDALRVASVLGIPADLAIGPAIETNDLIRERREALGLSEEELATRVGMSVNDDLEAYSWELLATLQLREARRLVKVLGIDLAGLLDLEGCECCPTLDAHPEWRGLPRHRLMEKRRNEVGLSRAEVGARADWFYDGSRADGMARYCLSAEGVARLESDEEAIEDQIIGGLLQLASIIGLPFPLLVAEAGG